jgi:hypothetical protein
MKITTTRTETKEITNFHEKPFSLFGKFREVRERHDQTMKWFNACAVCGKPFQDSDQAYFCTVTGKGNRLACGDCNTKGLAEKDASFI